MNDVSAITTFADFYGYPARGTASEDVARRLAELPSGSRLLNALAPGLYDESFLSLASLREDVSDFGGWERFLPSGAFWYAASALGVLYFATPDDRMWLVHSRAGSVMKTDFPLDEAILKAASPSTANELLLRPLFKAWTGDKGLLSSGAMLAPDPITADDRWDIQHYVPQASEAYLRASAALFQPVGPAPISVVSAGL